MTRWTLHHGDALDVLRTLPDASVDAVVTDPPAGIAFMGKSWDGHKGGRAAWVAWLSAILAECYRVAKPGARILCWSIPRTSHWTGCAVEDAGWLIENTIAHMFGSGFPKGKSQLKPAREDWWLARKPGGKVPALRIDECRINPGALVPGGGNGEANNGGGYGPVGAVERRGIRPIVEPHTAGRWPANVVLSHADGCERVGEHVEKIPVFTASHTDRFIDRSDDVKIARTGEMRSETVADWRCVEGCPVNMLDEQSGPLTSGVLAPHHQRHTAGGNGSTHGNMIGAIGQSFGDTGTASRFFQQFDPDPFAYFAKASRADRNAGCVGDDRANAHPTVKSTALMRYLVRLIAAPGSLVLDPFNGSGSTGRGALLEGCRYIGIERDAEYVEIARARLADAEREATPVQPALALGA